MAFNEPEDTNPTLAPTASDAAVALDGPSGLSVAVIIATTGRPHTSRRTIDRLGRQTRPPDRVVVVAVTPEDVAELNPAAVPVDIHFAPRGLCRQRNRGLEVLDGAFDLVVFFDDDFLPANDYLENAERLFLKYPFIVGATGRIIADGANGPGIPFEAAEALLEADSHVIDWEADLYRRRALYGCNMVFRSASIRNLAFDETLPLYGWQEDIDFSYRLSARGRVVKSDVIAGVHMGEKAGRTSGVRLGYSQIANPVYLLKKRSIPRDRAIKIIRNNVASNLWRSLAPEPYIDRRGRLMGNLFAMRDLALKRLHPERILSDLSR